MRTFLGRVLSGILFWDVALVLSSGIFVCAFCLGFMLAILFKKLLTGNHSLEVLPAAGDDFFDCDCLTWFLVNLFFRCLGGGHVVYKSNLKAHWEYITHQYNYSLVS